MATPTPDSPCSAFTTDITPIFTISRRVGNVFLYFIHFVVRPANICPGRCFFYRLIADQCELLGLNRGAVRAQIAVWSRPAQTGSSKPNCALPLQTSERSKPGWFSERRQPCKRAAGHYDKMSRWKQTTGRSRPAARG